VVKAVNAYRISTLERFFDMLGDFSRMCLGLKFGRIGLPVSDVAGFVYIYLLDHQTCVK
jgi:hypothetical protein